MSTAALPGKEREVMQHAGRGAGEGLTGKQHGQHTGHTTRHVIHIHVINTDMLYMFYTYML